MITDADIKKLKAVFATKDDLIGMEKRFDRKFATKDDLIGMEKRFDRKFATKNDLRRFATKDDITSIKSDMVSMEVRLKKEIVGAVVDYLQHNIIPILSEHDKRLDRLEKRVDGFPALA
jgi:hypothetical protein